MKTNSSFLTGLGLACLFIASVASAPAAEKAKARAGGGASFVLPETVKVERDIVYAKYGERELKLDLYLPKKAASAPLPCIVVIHGGGWRSGDKTRFARHAAYLADKGFAAACIGYRLIPEAKILDCAQDCKAAVRWVRASAKQYNINPDRLGAIGGSAGGHLVALLGTSYKEKKLEGNGGNEGVSSRIQAVVAMAPVTDFTAFSGRNLLEADVAALLSPAAHVDKDSAPVLLLHSNEDKTVPLKQSEILLEKYKAAGVQAEMVTVQGGGHAFWNQDPWFGENMARAEKFFSQQLKANEK